MTFTFIGLSEVTAITGYSSSTIRECMLNHGFPLPILLSDELVVWDKSDVDEWISQFHDAIRASGLQPPDVIIPG